MNAQVLSHSFYTKIIQSTTAITSIVICVANQLRIKRESAISRHCEANRRFAEAIQKNKMDCHDFAMQNLAMTGKSESSLRGNLWIRRSNPKKIICTKCKPNLARFVVQKIGFKDAVVRSADKLHKKIDCFGQSPRNDGVEGNELLCNGNEEYLSLQGDLLPTKQSTNRNNRLLLLTTKTCNDIMISSLRGESTDSPKQSKQNQNSDS